MQSDYRSPFAFGLFLGLVIAGLAWTALHNAAVARALEPIETDLAACHRYSGRLLGCITDHRMRGTPITCD